MTAETEALEGTETSEAAADFESMFRAQYARVARAIARVIRDPATAEELAVEVFLKFWRVPDAHGDRAEGWLHRVAVRKALDELRRRTRRARYEAALPFGRSNPTPEELRGAAEEQERIRVVLAAIGRRDAELLVLRSNGLSYDELASALDMNPASIGTLLRRAHHVFRREYAKRYGKDEPQ